MKTTDPNGLVTQYAYYDKTGNGRLRRLTTPDRRYTDFYYDHNGNVTRSVDNGGRETLTDYDALGRPVKTVGPVHDALGLAGIRQVTETQYTALGDVQKIRAGYRSATGVETLTDQAIYAYDDFGRVIEQTDALGHTTRWVYDAHGQPVRRESANGHIVEWEYDHSRNGLLTRQTAKLNATDPAPHVTDYRYDELGQVTGVDAPEVSYDYSYDNAQRLASVTDSRGGKTITYRHSPGGLLDSLEDNEGGRQDYLYDAVGRLSAIQSAGERIDFLFDAGGRLQETAMANGYRSLYRYSADGNLQELINRTAGDNPVSRHQYGYDSLGRRNSHLETIAGTVTDYRYQYDTLDRLRTVSTQNGTTLTQVEAYAYDAYGNRRQRTAQDSSVRRYLYDTAQQLTQVRSGSDTGTLLTSYSYDNAGNQTQRSGGVNLTLAYDALDRLASASGAGLAESYRYDHQGRRIETVSNGTPTRFVYSGRDILSEYGANWNAAQAHYAYAGLDQPLLRNTPSGNAYYHADGLGSVVATSNAAGAVTASARYDAFGQTINKTGTIPRYGYAGREPDATGLIHYRARSYDPSLGRFGQRDPAGFADGINPYAYVGNNPISFSDPLGLMKSVPSIWTAPSYPGSGQVVSVNAPSGLSSTKAGGIAGSGSALAIAGAIARSPTSGPGDYLLAGGVAAYGVYNAAMNNSALMDKMAKEVEKITQRPTGPDTEQYSLRAVFSGSYPNVRGGTVYLNAGDVWKYGQTSNPESRYPAKQLAKAGLEYVPEFRGSKVTALIQEKLKIYSYAIENGELPPGNKIFR
ncbi:RHS repeat domain-containing protein [Methylomonas sp. CM2]|uniref:RHS repeat domain-containing protein n=1 Tax=Methylomonas sp. CM2 TaxID=3417647 RepID=UPI003CE75B1D